MTSTDNHTQTDAGAYAALQAAGGNATKAAQATGMARTSFRAAIKRHEARLAQDEQAEGPVTAADPFAGIPNADDHAYDLEPSAEEVPVETPAPEGDLFPVGVLSPSKFRNHLVAEGIAPATLRPQIVYGWVKSATKGGSFPVAFYGPDNTKPGVNIEAGVAWYRETGGHADAPRTRRVRQPQWLVEERTGGMADEDIPFRLVIQTTDAVTAFRLAESKRQADDGEGFMFRADELEEVVPGYLWQAADGSSVVCEVRNLSAAV